MANEIVTCDEVTCLCGNKGVDCCSGALCIRPICPTVILYWIKLNDEWMVHHNVEFGVFTSSSFVQSGLRLHQQ